MSDPKTSVLVVEDEKAYADALALGLAREGFNVHLAATGTEAIEMFGRLDPDVVLLDLMLPGVSGVDVCREIRKHSSTPVIMVTARDSEVDTVVGLELGADDYITKPYRLRELVARMHAVLRRSTEKADVSAAQDIVSVPPVELDLARHAVRIRGEEVDLRLKEFELLEVLLLNAGRAVSRSSLMDQVWGYDFVGESKTLDVHVQRLRSRVELDPADPKVIRTIRGVGYRLETDGDGEA